MQFPNLRQADRKIENRLRFEWMTTSYVLQHLRMLHRVHASRMSIDCPAWQMVIAMLNR